MKFRKYFILILILVCGTISFTSCGSDETPTPVDTKNKIVGTWEFTDGSDYEIYVFNLDGTGTCTWTEYDEQGNLAKANIYYTYDKETNKLIVMFYKEDKYEDTEEYTITWINDNTFMNQQHNVYHRQ